MFFAILIGGLEAYIAYRPIDYIIPIKITKEQLSRGLSIRLTSIRKLASSINKLI